MHYVAPLQRLDAAGRLHATNYTAICYFSTFRRLLWPIHCLATPARSRMTHRTRFLFSMFAFFFLLEYRFCFCHSANLMRQKAMR